MNDQDYILFEGYISKTLSLEDMADFENKLKNNSEFKQAFITYKDLNNFLEHKFENEASLNAFKENVHTISDAYFNKENTTVTKTVKLTPWKYAIAASVVVLLGLFIFNNFSNPTYSDFSNYETISLTVRGEQESTIKVAETAFNSANYAEADRAFKKLLELDGNNAELQFYRAIANIELDKFEVADSLLKNLSKGNSAYKNKATWYLALSKLKQKENEACIGILKTIPEDAEDYKQAQKLLRKLE